MKLQLFNEDLTTKLQYLLNKYYRGDTTKLELLQQLAQLDPTPNYQYLEWIIKHHKSGAIIIPEDNEKIRQQLQQFHVLKNKQAFKTKHSPDINKYIPTTLYNALADYEGQGQESNRQIQRKTWHGKLALPPGSELILDDGEYQVVKITDVRASEILCTNTNWCTANTERAKGYLEKGPLYLVYVGGKRSYLVHYETEQFKYPDDTEVDNNTKLGLVELLSPVTGVDQYSSPKLAYWYVLSISNKAKDDRRIINAILQDPHIASSFANSVLGTRWPEAEPIIAKSPAAACNYIYGVLNGERWPEAEPYIMRDAIWAYNYAKGTLGERWPEAEPYIMKDARAAYWYAYSIRGRWPEAEPYIAKNPKWAYNYIVDVLDLARWPEAEPYIKSSDFAYYYAYYVLRGPWPEAEPYIKSSDFAYYYAYYVLRGPWPEAEPYIMKNPEHAYNYAYKVLKREWPEAEPYIIKNPNWACEYATHVMRRRWPEAESEILSNPTLAASYTRQLKRLHAYP